MLHQKRFMTTLALLTIASLIITACAQAAPTPQVIVQTQIVAGTPQVVTVTATPEPAPVVAFNKDDPTTFSYIVFGDADTLDPALAYDTASAEVIQNVMEPLIWFNREDATSYVPVLAEEIPSLDNGGISADGMTYTFNVRQGIKFHNGNDLTPSDIAYGIQRGLLQSDPNGPQWLLLEPILGYSSGDVTEEIGEGAAHFERSGVLGQLQLEVEVARRKSEIGAGSFQHRCSAHVRTQAARRFEDALSGQRCIEHGAMLLAQRHIGK